MEVWLRAVTFGEGLSQSLNIKNPLQGQNVYEKLTGPKSEVMPTSEATVQTSALNEGQNIGNVVAKGTPTESTGFFDSVKNFYKDRISPSRQSYLDSVAKINPATDLPYGENIFKQYAPLLAAGTGVMALTGGFDQKNPKIEDGVDTSRYPPVRVGMPMSPGQLPNYFYPGYDPIIPEPPRYVPMQAAKGGEMFPRRTGQISGPGTGTSDDIPAMLSDGEFVMTADAVKGAGNGSRQQGVRRMYDMMRKFEGGAV